MTIIININAADDYAYQALKFTEMDAPGPLVLNIATENPSQLDWHRLAKIYNNYYKPERTIQFKFANPDQKHPFVEFTSTQQALGCFLLESENDQGDMVDFFIKALGSSAAKQVFDYLLIPFPTSQQINPYGAIDTRLIDSASAYPLQVTL